MIEKLKRYSWTESFRDEQNDLAFNKQYMFFLDAILYELWGLGCNIILAWTPERKPWGGVVVPNAMPREGL